MVLALAGDSTMTSGRRPPRGRGPPGAPLPAWVSRDVSVRLVVAMAVAKGERWGELLSTPQAGHQGLKAPVTCGFSHVTVSYTHLRAHETVLDLVCRLLLEKKK